MGQVLQQFSWALSDLRSEMLQSVSSFEPSPVKVKRALLSVTDKTGLVEFARALVSMGVQLISTGGTAKAISDANIPVTPIEHITGLPEMLDGRVKTLHPAVHAGLLAVRDNPAHASAMLAHRLEPIDLVVINLYEFERTIANPNVDRAMAIENIDIGGPSMIRSAAKNNLYVTVATSPSQYDDILATLKANDGCSTPALRATLAAAAFTLTARYDTAISNYLNAQQAAQTHAQVAINHNEPAASISLSFTLAQKLKYGENPHQNAAVYKDPTFTGPSILTSTQLHGKELGFNNVADADAALALAWALAQSASFASVGAAVIKHANPCGAALAPSAATAIDKAIAGDPLAAFGGILACSHTIDVAAASRLVGKDTFLEVIIAPDFSPDALDMLKAKSVAMRILRCQPLAHAVIAPSAQQVMRTIPGGLLVQDRDLLAPRPEMWIHAAGPKLDERKLAHIKHAGAIVELFVRAMASNAIAIGAADSGPASEPGAPAVRLLGGGVGQVDRVTACKIAIEKARTNAPALLASGLAIAVSDAFFPFPDGPKILIDGGVGVLIHPGGSKRDQETFDLCNASNVTCLVTSVRRFKH